MSQVGVHIRMPILSMKFNPWMVFLGLPFLLVACSGGGDSGGGGTTPVATPSVGRFIDSPVQNLGYKATPSGFSGLTNANGEYNYLPGDMVAFNLYGRPIGSSVSAGSVVTPLMLFKTTDLSDTKVVNLSRLLLTLGSILPGANTIVLPTTVPAGFPATLTIDFTSSTFDTMFSGLPNSLVTAAGATAHLHESFKTVTVTVTNTGSITSSPAGINCTSGTGTCSAVFTTGTPVTLTAIGTGFNGWTGATCSGTGVCAVTLTIDQAVTGTFKANPPPATLTINPNPGTGTGVVQCSVNNVSFVDCAASYPNGTPLILHATPDNGSTFTGWSKGTGSITCTGSIDCPVTLIANSSVTATFTRNVTSFVVTTNTSSANGGNGGVQCLANGVTAKCGSYPVNTQVTLVAMPNAVSNFTGWSGGGCSGPGNCVIITLLADTTITANFNRPTLTVTVGGTGSVSSSPAGITCPGSCTAPFDKGTPVTLTASGSGFTGWAGAACPGTGTCVVTLAADTAVTANFVAVSTAFTYPLKVGPTSRYLVDQNGKPFLLVGDAAWSLMAVLSKADADLYLENRRQLGFTAILASLIEHRFSSNPPANFYGDLPFAGSAFSSTPNEAYFAHVDYVVQSAAAKGIVILLAPLYLGYNCGGEGWCTEVQAASTSDMATWGQYIGTRYKDYDNIVWVIGGDTDPTPVKAKVQAMVDGIRSVDTRHLFTAHNSPEQMAVTPWAGADWLTVNNVYTNGSAYQAVLNGYERSPAMPVFLVESTYENENGVSSQDLRAQSYGTVLSGGFGHVFGNCPIWGFGFASAFCASTNWQAQLNNVGSLNMQHFAALFNSRHWGALVPDTSHAVLTSGYGTFGQSDFVTAACAEDGSSIIAYLPSVRTVTVSGACLNGSTMIAWWYDPSSGVANQIKAYSTTQAQSFTPPSVGDWVLVLDSTSFSFPPPGSL